MESDGNSSIVAKEEDESHLKEIPKILPLPNGPYYLLNDMQPKIVENLQSSEGKQLSTNTLEYVILKMMKLSYGRLIMTQDTLQMWVNMYN